MYWLKIYPLFTVGLRCLFIAKHVQQSYTSSMNYCTLALYPLLRIVHVLCRLILAQLKLLTVALGLMIEQLRLMKNLKESRPSEHPPVSGENVETFRGDYRLYIFFFASVFLSEQAACLLYIKKISSSRFAAVNTCIYQSRSDRQCCHFGHCIASVTVVATTMLHANSGRKVSYTEVYYQKLRVPRGRHGNVSACHLPHYIQPLGGSTY